MARKKISFRERDASGPPGPSPWIWHTLDLLRSNAWRDRTAPLMRLLDFLEVEHLRQDREQNGKLMSLYEDLVRHGRISRKAVAPAAILGERLGLLERTVADSRGPGKLPATLYRLTYLPTVEIDPVTKVKTWHAPTDEWRHYVPESDKRQGRKTRAKNKRRVSSAAENPVPIPTQRQAADQNHFDRSQESCPPAPQWELGTKPEANAALENPVPQNTARPSAPMGTTSTYLGVIIGGDAPPPDPSRKWRMVITP